MIYGITARSWTLVSFAPPMPLGTFWEGSIDVAGGTFYAIVTALTRMTFDW